MGETLMSSDTPERLYVVSSDSEITTQSWTRERGLQVPDNGFFIEQQKELQLQMPHFVGGEVEILSTNFLQSGLRELIGKTAMDVVSMDNAYVRQDMGIRGFLEVTRAVDERLIKLQGLYPRRGADALSLQLNRLRTDTERPICIVDDVLFSGDCMLTMIDELKLVNRPVEKIIVGVAIGEGIEVLKEKAKEVEVVHVQHYDDVIDEVCERDFVAGAPMSGRTMYADDGTVWSIPYFPPMGSADWASILEPAIPAYAAFAREHSARYWAEMERVNRRPFSGREIPQPIRNFVAAKSIAAALRDPIDLAIA